MSSMQSKQLPHSIILPKVIEQYKFKKTCKLIITLTVVYTSIKHKREHGRDRGEGGGGEMVGQNHPPQTYGQAPTPIRRKWNGLTQSVVIETHVVKGVVCVSKEKYSVWTCIYVGGVGCV